MGSRHRLRRTAACEFFLWGLCINPVACLLLLLLLQEREVVMCAAVDAACTGRLPQGDAAPNTAAGTTEAATAAAAGPPKEVVVVVGAGHLPGGCLGMWCLQPGVGGGGWGRVVEQGQTFHCLSGPSRLFNT
jgi:hypothetical protein